MCNAVVKWKAPHSDCLSEQGIHGASFQDFSPCLNRGKTGRGEEEGSDKKKGTKIKAQRNPLMASSIINMAGSIILQVGLGQEVCY